MQIVLAALIATILGTLVLLMLFGSLAALIPALRYAFLLMITLIPWIIYVNIRRYVGRLWWFIQSPLDAQRLVLI
jgi:hypothetical protein